MVAEVEEVPKLDEDEQGPVELIVRLLLKPVFVSGVIIEYREPRPYLAAKLASEGVSTARSST